jgi:lipoprotein
MRQKLTGIICCFGLLAACTDPAPTPDPNALSITPFVNELFQQHLNNLTPTEELSLAEVYGDQWKEFAVFCPYWDGASMAESYGITDHPFNHEERLGKNERYLYLSDMAGEQEWIRLGGSVNFCSADGPGSSGLASTSETMFFQLTDYGAWERIPPPAQNSTEPTTATQNNSP